MSPLEREWMHPPVEIGVKTVDRRCGGAMGGRRRPARSFAQGRVPGMKTGKSKKTKYTKWKAITAVKAAGATALRGKKGKQLTAAKKRLQKKNHGRLPK